MGHERIGFIPKTKQWQSIVAQLQTYDGDKSTVSKVAADTIDALKALYSSLAYDSAIIASIRFLATVCHFSGSSEKLKEIDVETKGNITMYSLLQGANQYLSDESDSMEVGKLTKKHVGMLVHNIETDELFSSIQEAANKYGCNRSSISSALNGDSKTSMGCHWEFVRKD